MEVILLGVSYFDFKNPENGELIQGYKVHFASPKAGTNGFAVDSKSAKLDSPYVQQLIDVYKNHKQFPCKAVLHFNQYGGFAGIDIK